MLVMDRSKYSDHRSVLFSDEEDEVFKEQDEIKAVQ